MGSTRPRLTYKSRTGDIRKVGNAKAGFCRLGLHDHFWAFAQNIIALLCLANKKNMNSLVKANPLTDQCNVFPAPQHFLNILPEPQGHNTLRPTVSMLNFPGCDGVRCASQ